ncbi:phosphonate C-P lyase system protein PhnH [Neptuniibacter halophilus]|uniref:phosphonate C-P lyase system protein PhnH n=1 Tax=Neptuniibacter halophilus TaxID=651666 RepID=UPI0025730AAF|nr:phosphonate C-P lyase system protein PhnH [Neptuniibacter halophilus]
MNKTQVDAELLIGGFPQPVADSQQLFRSALKAMSEPGTQVSAIKGLNTPEQLQPGSWQLALALFDPDTRIWLSPRLRQNASLLSNLRFHCRCPMTDEPKNADFALADADELPDLDRFNWGSSEYPDRSTTLIIQVPAISDEPFWQLSGPGIEHSRPLRIGGLDATFREQLIASRRRFPLGIDTLFCSGETLVALPRTTRINEESV